MNVQISSPTLNMHTFFSGNKKRGKRKQNTKLFIQQMLCICFVFSSVSIGSAIFNVHLTLYEKWKCILLNVTFHSILSNMPLANNKIAFCSSSKKKGLWWFFLLSSFHFSFFFWTVIVCCYCLANEWFASMHAYYFVWMFCIWVRIHKSRLQQYSESRPFTVVRYFVFTIKIILIF